MALTAFLVLLINGCSSSESESALTPTYYSAPVSNLSAYITSQCYTKTDDSSGEHHNPCFACHINSQIPNYVDDSDLQKEYPGVTVALTNPWTNLFKDRTTLVEAISDAAILEYVRTDNYKDVNGSLLLSQNLRALPEGWDSNGNGYWEGYIPDCYFNFDSDGFDRNDANIDTGWRAFAYYPFLGTFWPTNGSADDVIIRLAPVFRSDDAGSYDREVYKINLSIVEAVITRRNVVIDPVDENKFGVDLDKDGTLGTATQITYDWAPLEDRYMYYVGAAKKALEEGNVHLAAGLYPEGTEFLHSVRYLDVQNDQVTMAARMKELRYARKGSWYTYSELRQLAEREAFDKQVEPEKYRRITGNYEMGYFNAQGWRFQGFIEDETGGLRPQNNEETVFCMGCHGGIGATEDSIFSFGRKFDETHHNRGWYHWSAKGFTGEKEPLTPDGRYEYSLYLETNHAGDEFRHNDEVMEKFFDANGVLKSDAIALLHDDMATLLLPSTQRALTLNKAYKVIVDEQSFTLGRDAHVKPVESVHQEIEAAQSTGNSVVKYTF